MSVFKGHEADNAIPKVVRTSKTDQNHAAAFDYELVIPNQWAGVTMQLDGQPGEAGALPPDDVSGYKVLSIQAYVTGTSYMRVGIMSNGRGINLHSGYPMTSLKLNSPRIVWIERTWNGRFLWPRALLCNPRHTCGHVR
jgi:hypothetical protein